MRAISVLAVVVVHGCVARSLPPTPDALRSTRAALRVRGGDRVVASRRPAAVATTAVARGGGGGGGEMTEAQQREFQGAIIMTVLTIASATLFGAGVWALRGAKTGMEFFAGYLVEQALSVDNLFVFILLFDYFKARGAPSRASRALPSRPRALARSRSSRLSLARARSRRWGGGSARRCPSRCRSEL